MMKKEREREVNVRKIFQNSVHKTNSSKISASQNIAKLFFYPNLACDIIETGLVNSQQHSDKISQV